MSITHRPYTNSEADRNAVKAMLVQVSQVPELDSNWDAGRTDYWQSCVHGDKSQSWFEANAHTWHAEDGSVIGWFVCENGNNDFFFVAHPNHLDLLPDIVAWGLQVWGKGKASVVTSVRPHDIAKVNALQAHGFLQGRKENNVRTYDLSDYDCSYTLKQGFTLTSFREYGNYESHVALTQNSFNNPGYTETRMRAIHANKTYQPDLDLVIANGDGMAVGYCIGWVVEEDPTQGYIEPLGVHSDYRRNGFATALVKECFRRMIDKGVRSATIASGPEPKVSNLLYESLKPVSMVSAYVFEKDLT